MHTRVQQRALSAADMRQTVLSAALVVAWAAITAATRNLTPVHVVFLTDCTKYSNWQSIGDTFSFKMSGQPGTVSRVTCCTPEEKASYDHSLKSEVDTWIAPSFAVHPKTKDNYAAYNKPEAVIDWLENITPKEDYILVLDSDMVLRRPFLVEDMKPSPGWAIGARYTYMIGVANELADRHIPEIPKRNDTFAGPFGRRADQVGGFFFVNKADLKRMSHGWLKYTEDVRADPEAYRLSGDVYAIHPGDKPWISEMYGYAFGAATAGVWHHWDPISMIYPGYEPVGVPKLMHYGLLFEVGSYKFDKHWHYDFDVTQCPPWDLSSKKVTAGIFPPPPHPKTLTNQNQRSKYYQDLLAIETVATLNAGFCDYHLRHCPPSKQLLDVCTEAVQLYMDTMKAVEEVEKEFKCGDRNPKCKQWAEQGECEKNHDYMIENCARACGACHAQSEDAPRPEPKDTLDALARLRLKLSEGGSSGSGGSGSGTQTQAHKGDPDGHAADPDVAASQKKVIIPHTDSPHKTLKVKPVTSHKLTEDLSPVHISTNKQHHTSPAGHTPATDSDDTHSVTISHKSDVVPKDEMRDKDEKVAMKTIKPRKDLLIRCYRLSVGPKEVRECVAMANKGLEWHPEKDIKASQGGGTAFHARKQQAIADHDNDDLRQLQEELTQAPKTKTPRVKQAAGLGPTLAGLNTWQAVGLWALLIGVLLVAVPRVLRLRKRPRSGMRSE